VIGNAAVHLAQISTGFDVVRLQVAMGEYIAAARSPQLSDPVKRKLRRPTATQGNALSAMLLSISTVPLPRYSFSAFH
jgi:hypothetical protein